MFSRIISIRTAASSLVGGPLLTGLLLSDLAMWTTLPRHDTNLKDGFGEPVLRVFLVVLKNTTKSRLPSGVDGLNDLNRIKPSVFGHLPQ